jgi:holliday junction DNA helicase RuvA
MIERVTGLVAARFPDGAVLELGGMGLRVEASATTMRDIPPLGEMCSLFTYLHVREDALQLFGFSTEDERGLFQLLIAVSKIGPKLALAVLSARRPQELRRTIALGDIALLQAVPGIGKKTAERMVLELKDKVGDLVPGAPSGATTGPSADDDNLTLARAALQELGLGVLEAEQLLRGLDPAEPVQTLIRQALGRR